MDCAEPKTQEQWKTWNVKKMRITLEMIIDYYYQFFFF